MSAGDGYGLTLLCIGLENIRRNEKGFHSPEYNKDSMGDQCQFDALAQRRLLMAIRQALIIALGALEDYLGLQHSIIPRRKRNVTET